MTTFVILRIQRQHGPNPFDEVTIKFFPLYNSLNTELTLEAETSEAGFDALRVRFPRLFRFMAIQDEQSYRRTIARLLTNRVFRGTEAKNVPSPQPVGGRTSKTGESDSVFEIRAG